MGNDQEHFALEWIKGEILETLGEARASLEEYVESGQDATRMRACLTSLHQVHGTLVMLELKGVTLLADHLEQLAQKLLAGEVRWVNEATQSLMQGILELPGYIEEIQRGLPDSTQPLLPLVNEMRAYLQQEALGAEVTSIAQASSDAAVERFREIDGPAKVKKIRAAYQQVLLSILKGEDLLNSLETLTKVAMGLKRVCEHTELEAQWQAFAEFVESLAVESSALDGSAVKLLRRVDAEIRTLVTEGAPALRKPASRELVEQLLEAAERRDHHSEALTSLKETVTTRVGQSDGLTISGRQALASAAEALSEELALVKDQLDLFVRSGSQSVEALTDLVASLKQINSTLSLLGFESSLAIVSDQLTLLDEMIEDGTVERRIIESVAASLVQVDENLKSHRRGVTSQTEKITGEAQRSVVIEARSGLENIKQSVVDYVSSQWDARHLDGVLDQMTAICGALEMIPLSRAARLLSECASYVESEMLGEEAPGWEQLNLFADAVSGVDYYLERLAENNQAGAEDILDIVDRTLRELQVAPREEIFARAPSSVPAEDPVAPQADEFEIELEKELGDEVQQVPAEPEPEATDADEPSFVEPEPVEAPVEVRTQSEEPKLALEEDADFNLDNLEIEDEEADEVAVPPSVAGSDETAEMVTDLGVPEKPTEPESIEEPVAARPEEQPIKDAPIGELTPPPAENEVPALEAADEGPDVDEPDPEIVEIFVEEVTEVLAAIEEFLPQWQAAMDTEEPLIEVRRAFHTLKGSGRIVGATEIGELAWSVENMLNRIIDTTVEANEQFVVVVNEAVDLIPAMRDAFEMRTGFDMSRASRVMERADVLASGGNIDEAAAPVAPMLELDTALEDEAERVGSMFVQEAEQHLAVLSSKVSGGDSMQLDEEAMRAWHTLKGSAAMAELEDVSVLIGPIYDALLAYRANFRKETVTADAGRFFVEALGVVEATIATLRDGGEVPDPSQTIVDADRWTLEFGSGEGDESLLEVEGIGSIMTAQDFLAGWRAGALDLAQHEQLTTALGGLERAATSMEYPTIAALAAGLGEAYGVLEDGALGEAAHEVLLDAHDRLLEQLDAIAADQSVPDAAEVIAQLSDLGEPISEEVEQVADELEQVDSEPAQVQQDEPLPTPSLEEAENLEDVDEVEEVDSVEDIESVEEIESVEQVDEPAPIEAEARPEVPVQVPSSDVDPEIIGVFFEEADEIMETVDQNIQDWSAETGNLLYLENLLRGLHTLKGGARLSGLTELGDLTHQFESFLIDVQDTGASVDEELFRALHDRHDELVGLLTRIRDAVEVEGVDAAAAESPPAPTADEVVVQPEPKSDIEEQKTQEPAAEAPETRTGQEMVRVGSMLLENLVNLAGESSIIRARIEQGMSDFTNALDEMETTIERVREQLRRLEIETETQVLFRQELKDGPTYDEFDPLEMDRYSHLQQLSRGLSESASDMLDLKETLLFKARESETLLIQQARINTELQEGLMRTRMVPFNRLLPRLRRIVRQIAKELGKEVEFHAYNAEGELDRNLLERMVPPLEHMLRNAVDHGIESPELRRGFGKSDRGRIDLRLSREGGDVVIEISDDGSGIDIENVREKAVERGLMAADAELRDDEIYQFILAPGFTTAKSVTQISGRGVGMDVVHSGVKQLGGSIGIFSRPGKGSRFVVRVPFTVSVNRALMVAVKEDLYAIPLNTIEGIVLLTPNELEKLYADDAKPFEYAGVPYRVRYLGQYLGREFQGQHHAAVPVVLVRAGDQSVAVHVDAVQGSREIVVKSLGPQFAGVGGISGATILGDGRVVVILDLLALIRGARQRGAAERREAQRTGRSRCVMVVDDSVTVRKVTSRLLERQGMEVVVAKDGIEAVALLQERRPDIMLLDIEMPRMDGFEVARQVRHDERLESLPIVMISSRTGEKHQEHASELGVNKFLGKPFQENELLATIDELVNSE